MNIGYDTKRGTPNLIAVAHISPLPEVVMPRPHLLSGPKGAPCLGLLWCYWVAAGATGSAVALLLGRADPPAFFTVLGACPGLAVGAGQWGALRGHIEMKRWRLALWLCASALGSWAWLGFLDFADYTYDFTAVLVSGVIVAGLVGLLVGSLQALAFVGRVPGASTWLGIVVLGDALGWPAGTYVGNLLLTSVYGAILGYASSAMLTGLGVVWLLRRAR
jgi:hypothetical protein